MAYSTSAPPALIAQRIGGGGQVWHYESVDGQTDVDAANYFTNGGSLGMASYAHVYVVDNNASPVASSLHMVNATGDGTTDLNNGVAITATDSD